MAPSIRQAQTAPLEKKFTAAIETLVEQVKHDKSILAAILCGSLAHDRVWAKSDVDLVFVTIDDSKIKSSGVALYADEVNVHAMLIPRGDFKKMVESAVHNSFAHSFLAKGRLLYTHDPSLAELCDRLQARGGRDATIQLLRAATWAIPCIDKAHKWFVTRGDLEYSALWLLHAATPLAFIEVVSAGQLADRELLPQALKLNATFFQTIYNDLLNQRKTKAAVKAALDAVDHYLGSRAEILFEPVLEHLRETGDVRSATDLEDHFRRHFDLSGITTACEYLADRGLIEKASTAVQLTRRSNVEVQELAFFLPGGPPDGF